MAHGDFGSYHEAYAILLGEMDELWAAIKDKRRNRSEIMVEAIQVGAMALKLLTATFPREPLRQESSVEWEGDNE